MPENSTFNMSTFRGSLRTDNMLYNMLSADGIIAFFLFF